MRRAVVALAAASLIPATAVAQDNRTRVTYTVELRTTGGLLDRNCTATGTDILTGLLVGFEPPEPNEDNVYVGTLTRTTSIATCGSRRTAQGHDVPCTINYRGNGIADVMLTVQEGRRGAYLEYIDNRATWAALLPPRPAGPTNSVVTGTCDPAELSQLQDEYEGGQTAGSPNGQPLEVPGFPPMSPRPSLPLRFPANPPQSIWTVTILDRRP
jgi:hypothetical protein